MNDEKFDEGIAEKGVVYNPKAERLSRLTRDDTMPRHNRLCQIVTATVVAHMCSIYRADFGIVVFSRAFNQNCHHSPNSFRHDDVGLSETVGIWHNACENEPAFLIELVRMIADVANIEKVFQRVRKQIDPIKRGEAVFVV